jgi:hypothetical protein
MDVARVCETGGGNINNIRKLGRRKNQLQDPIQESHIPHPKQYDTPILRDKTAMSIAFPNTKPVLLETITTRTHKIAIARVYLFLFLAFNSTVGFINFIHHTPCHVSPKPVILVRHISRIRAPLFARIHRAGAGIRQGGDEETWVYE